jgi:hypothetical protein
MDRGLATTSKNSRHGIRVANRTRLGIRVASPRSHTVSVAVALVLLGSTALHAQTAMPGNLQGTISGTTATGVPDGATSNSNTTAASPGGSTASGSTSASSSAAAAATAATDLQQTNPQ